MTTQLSIAVRNAKLDAIETAIGASAVLRIRSGAQPANCAAPDSGVVVAEVDLPADWMSAAINGTKSRLGTWTDNAADASGTAGHWRIYDAAGTTCHMQGSVTATGGGGDMEINNTVLAAGQEFSVDTFSFTEGNA